MARIVEERDASPAEREINEINSGIYAFELDALFDALRSIGAENAQGEYYLPDLVAIYRRQRRPVATLDRGERQRDSRHQQPERAGRGEPYGATTEERRADGGRRHA